MKRAGYIKLMEEIINSYQISVEELEAKRLAGRFKRRQEEY
jgi:hypothetical protein